MHNLKSMSKTFLVKHDNCSLVFDYMEKRRKNVFMQLVVLEKCYNNNNKKKKKKINCTI